MKKYLVLVLCLFFLFSFVSAENYQGTLGEEGTNYTTFSGESGSNIEVLQPLAVAGYANDIELSGNMKSVVVFSTVASTYAMKLDTGAPSGATTSAKFIQCTGEGTNTSTGLPSQCVGGRVLGTGTVGYQRIYNTASPPVEQAGGYIYITMNSWNTAGLTGDIPFYIEYDRPSLYNLSTYKAGSFGPGSQKLNSAVPSGRVGIGYTFYNTFYAPFPSSFYTNYRIVSVLGDYYVIDEAGLGIQGSITKTAGLSQGIIYSGVTGSILASESSNTANMFNFTMAEQPIIIGIKNAAGTKYNSSILFSGVPTPTPTPIGGATPTPTYTTGILDFSNVTIQVADSANARIANAYVEYYPNQNTVDNIQGYTDINGEITFGMVARTAAKVVVYKSGYEERTDYFTPSALDYTRYIQVFTGASAIPQTINLTITTRNSNGGALIPSVYVSYYDQMLGGGTASYTNASGIITFTNVPNTAYIAGELSKAGYVTRTWSIGYQPMSDISLILYMSDGSSGVGPTPPPVTPTPTPVIYDTVTLSASPTAVAVNEPVTLTTTCTGSVCANGTVNVATYNVNTGSGIVTIGTYRYNSTSTKYDYRAGSIGVWQIGSNYNPLKISHTPTSSGAYTYYVSLTKLNFISIGSASRVVQVGGAPAAGGLVMKLFAADQSTTSQLSNYNLNITNSITGELTELGDIIYNHDILLPRGVEFTLQCSKENYDDGTNTFIVPLDAAIVQGSSGALAGCYMFPTGSGAGGAGNTSVAVHVSDPETYYPINRVLIAITASGLSISPRYTGDNGESALFIIPHNTAYTIKASKDGYCSISDSKNTGTLNYQYVPLYMKYGECLIVTPTPTPSVTPTPFGWTPTPAITQIGGWGNISSPPAVCMHLPADASFVDIIINTLACNGFEDKQSQNIGLSVLIIILLGIIFGKVAGGIGVIGGAVVGVLFATAMGLLPFWIIIVLIIIAGLIFAVRIFSSGGE